MFRGASAFNQNLCRWNKDFTSYIDFCSGASCGTSDSPPSSSPSKHPIQAPSQNPTQTPLKSQNPTQTPSLNPTPALSKATCKFITGLVALCCIIAFEII